MDTEKPPGPGTRGSAKRAGARRVLVFDHTGDGRDKRAVASGLALHAQGRGKPVATCRLVKLASRRFGEPRAGTPLARHRVRATVPAQRGSEQR